MNLSRAWAFTRVATCLAADDDRRVAALLAATERHADASLPQVAGGDYYIVKHWLAAYATPLLS